MSRPLNAFVDPDDSEVDEAVAELQREHEADGTGGRGANGEITKALEESWKKEEALKDAV